MLTTVFEKRIDGHSENFNKELGKKKKKNQSELKNTITEMKNTLEGIKRRGGDTPSDKWSKR